jgi:hypothetical protein
VKLDNAPRLFADSVASLDTRRLRQAGLFDAAQNLITFTCQMVSPDALELKVELSWDAEASSLTIATPDLSPPRRTTVSIGRRDPARGGGYYFICPMSAERCEKLYFAGGGWGARKAKRLTYSSQNGSLADRYSHTALRLTAELEGAGGRALPCPERQAQIADKLSRIEQRLAGVTPRRSRARVYPDAGRHADLALLARPPERIDPLRGPALATQRAIERAQAMSDEADDTIQWLYRRGDAFRALLDQPATTTAAAGLAPDFVENHPRISLRALELRGFVRPGARRGVQLDWRDLGCEIDHCNLLLDLRDEDAAFAGLELFSGPHRWEQALRVTGKGCDLAFVCPVFDQPVETIAFRAGLFAAPQALRMTRRPGRA